MFRNCVSGKKYSIIKSMNITQIREKIEETLKSYLPQTASQDWQKMNFGKLPAAIDETHFQQLLSPCFSLMSLGGKRWRPVLQVLCAMMVSNQKGDEQCDDDKRFARHQGGVFALYDEQ